MKKFNINSHVYVKLTTDGIKHLKSKGYDDNFIESSTNKDGFFA